MSPKLSLYNKVVSISEDFLGPAGERFMRRQIVTHLRIEPEALQKKHLPELVEWVRLASAVLTRDSAYVNDFAEQILNLAKANGYSTSTKALNGSSR